MRILFVVRSLEIGGAEQQLTALAGGLVNAGHECAVAVFYRGGGLEHKLADASVRLIDLGTPALWSAPRALNRLRACVRSYAPDVVHSYMETANVLCALAAPFWGGVPLIWGIRNSEMVATNYKWTRRTGQALEKALAAVPALTISNSMGGREMAISRGMSRGNVAWVPNGIDCDRFHRRSDRGRTFRSELGVAENAPLIGLVARLDPMKDHPTFLRAMAMVRKGLPHAQFVCVGDGPAVYRERLAQLGRELGLDASLRWMTARRDVEAVYSALDVLVLSSRYGEGFPNVLGEAMSCECLCVATDSGDAAAVIGHHGVLVPPGQSEAIASAVFDAMKLSSGDRAARAALAREWIGSQYSIASLVDRTLQCIAERLGTSVSKSMA